MGLSVKERRELELFKLIENLDQKYTFHPISFSYHNQRAHTIRDLIILSSHAGNDHSQIVSFSGRMLQKTTAY